MSWQKLGVPMHIVKYIGDMDKDCLTISLTPHAMQIMSSKSLDSFNLHLSSKNTTSGFFSETGAPQGDTPSPMNWNAVIDVLLRALHDIGPTPYLIRADSALHLLADTAYVDDILSARRKGLQLKADTVSAFTIIFGIKVAIYTSYEH